MLTFCQIMRKSVKILHALNNYEIQIGKIILFYSKKG